MEETKLTEIDLALDLCAASVEMVELRNRLSAMEVENEQYKAKVRIYLPINLKILFTICSSQIKA